MSFEPSTRAAGLRTIAQASESLGVAEAKHHFMDQDAFRIFYDRTSRILFVYLYRVSGNRDLSEDLLQEAYCRILSVDLKGMDEAQSRSYLFKIATNLLRDHWRREKKNLSGIPNEQAQASNPETELDLRTAFEQLKARERQLLWLAYVEGSSHDEIAKTTGLRSGSIRLLLFRARKKLANALRSGQTVNQKVNL